MRDTRIVIAHRGWVFVGEYERTQIEVVLHRAKVIRRWGTTNRGLGALRDGPLPETILDEAGTVRMHPLQIIATFDANGEAWDSHLL